MRALTKARHKRHWPARQRGAVAVLLTVAMLALLAMAGLALDGGHLLLNKTRLQNAVDAAALSGAKTLSQVMGSTGSASMTLSAARNTFALNASAPGNAELGNVLGVDGAGVVVELASSVYGPFSFPGPSDARYVKVSVPEYGLAGFFWGLLQSLGSEVGEKQIAAVAVAGPSPTAPCDISPLMVCGDPSQYNPAAGLYWGYRFGDLEVLKSAAGNTPAIGPGNFQLVRLGSNSGAADIRDALCRGIRQCQPVGSSVPTEPGNSVGPVAQGLNTRFGVYNGPVSSSSCPPDLVTDFSTPRMTYNDSVSPPRVEYRGEVVTSSDGDLSTASAQLFDYNDWKDELAQCPQGCEPNGVSERRLLKIVVGDCTGASGGMTSVPVLGFGCFFVLQTVSQQGTEAQVFGQFVEECSGDGYPGPNPADAVGPQIIQLYKTFTNGPGTPGSDS